MIQKSLLTKLLASFVLIVYVLGMSSVFLPLIEYAIDYKKISTEKCENIAKPELGCNGKCYLSKQIKKQADNETKVPDEKGVAIKLGIDPHYSTPAAFTNNLYFTNILFNNNIPFEDIVQKIITPPPEC